MLRQKNKHPRDAKEFLYHRIDLTPLVDAAKKNDWGKLKSLLDNGYSLLWSDHKSKKSAMRLIKENGNYHLVEKVIEYSSALHGKDSAAHCCVMLEEANDPLKCAVKLYNAAHNALMSDNPASDDFLVDPTSVYYLYMQDPYAAMKLIRDDNRYFKDNYALLAALLRAAAKRLDDTKLVELFDTFVMAESDNPEREADIKKLGLSIAAENGMLEWVLFQIKEMQKHGAPDLEEYFGSAIVGAARGGRSKLLFSLYKLAGEYQLDHSDAFIKHFSYAAGAALVNENYMLAKAIMQLVPHFNAYPADLEELKSWQSCKIERMFKMIRNYKIFTDISLHSGLAKGIDAMSWSHALKVEYGLEDMSDEGFNELIHHPEALTLLFKYEPAKNIDKASFNNPVNANVIQLLLQHAGLTLSVEDMNAFLKVMNQAKAEVNRKPSSIPFFRLRHLIDEKPNARMTPQEQAIFLETKNEIMKKLNEKIRERMVLSNTKALAKQLRENLLDVTSMQMLKKALDKATKENKNNALLKECKGIINKHQTALMPSVRKEK